MATSGLGLFSYNVCLYVELHTISPLKPLSQINRNFTWMIFEGFSTEVAKQFFPTYTLVGSATEITPPPFPQTLFWLLSKLSKQSPSICMVIQ